MRPEKKEIVEEIFRKIDASNAVIITNYTGLKSAKLTELRRQLKGVKAEYMVIKNTLMTHALAMADITGLDPHLKGATAVLFVRGDQAETAKVLVKYAKANEFPKIKVGVINKSVTSKEKIEYLATLPSKDVMIATLVSRLKSPIYGLVMVLGGIERKLVCVLQAIKEKKEKEGPAQQAGAAPQGDATAAAGAAS
ncbi:MAG TPA: 50S ribosomal protein L10 [bacterium]|nr:50S ribosomal protein L10 [bacterium]